MVSRRRSSFFAACAAGLLAWGAGSTAWAQDASTPASKGTPSKDPAGAPASDAAPSMSLPAEVTIRAEDSAGRVSVSKPPLNLEVDPYESIRPALKPDESLLLAISPLTVSWRRTHPEFLKNERVIQPWRTTFSPRPGIVFHPLDQLFEALQRKLEPKESKDYGWSLSIVDEEGRVFHRYEGADDPPDEIVWSGQNEPGEWIQAGRSYSAVYTFTEPGGARRTNFGKPLLFKGIVHQEESGLYISLDAAVLFGKGKSGAELAKPGGEDLMRSAADLIKRRFGGIPMSVRVFAGTKELGESQGNNVAAFLVRELMINPPGISVAAARAAFSESRVDIVLMNR
ncbi:MAG: hypothetical protein HY927_09115 [Elusimicrobia bacterium]|nr:hypothetical protein [Elusimicrobiota bacterium]